jgi:hypothetical protein
MALRVCARTRRLGISEKFSLAALASVPFLLDLLLRLFGEGSSWKGLVWNAMGAFLSAALLLGALWGWPQVRALAAPIESLFALSGDDLVAERVAYLGGVRRRLPVGRLHYLLCAAVALVGAGVAAYGSTQIPRHTTGPAYFLAVGVLGALGTDAVVWMLRTPLILVRPLAGVAKLRVVMHAPATTPAIRKMGDLATQTAVRCGIGFFLFGLPALWAVFSAKHGGHHISHEARLALLGVVPLAVTAAVASYVLFVPQLWLSRIVTRQRDRIVEEVGARLPSDDPLSLLESGNKAKADLYDRLASSEAESKTVRKVVALLAVVLPQAIGVAGKLLKIG